jgi:hypothetical protein
MGPVPDAFAAQTDVVTDVEAGDAVVCWMFAAASVPLTSAHVPPIGAPATVATDVPTPPSAHGLVAAVPVLIVLLARA